MTACEAVSPPPFETLSPPVLGSPRPPLALCANTVPARKFLPQPFEHAHHSLPAQARQLCVAKPFDLDPAPPSADLGLPAAPASQPAPVVALPGQRDVVPIGPPADYSSISSALSDALAAQRVNRASGSARGDRLARARSNAGAIDAVHLQHDGIVQSGHDGSEDAVVDDCPTPISPKARHTLQTRLRHAGDKIKRKLPRGASMPRIGSRGLMRSASHREMAGGRQEPPSTVPKEACEEADDGCTKRVVLPRCRSFLLGRREAFKPPVDDFSDTSTLVSPPATPHSPPRTPPVLDIPTISMNDLDAFPTICAADFAASVHDVHDSSMVISGPPTPLAQKEPPSQKTTPIIRAERRVRESMDLCKDVVEEEKSEFMGSDIAYVTIQRVVRRVLADGTEKIVKYNVRIKPERVLENGDVVVKRKVQRAMHDGSGMESLTVMQVIPRKQADTPTKSSAAKSPKPESPEASPPSETELMLPTSEVGSGSDSSVRNEDSSSERGKLSSPERFRECCAPHSPPAFLGSSNGHLVRNLIKRFEAIEQNDSDVNTALRKEAFKSPPAALDLAHVSCLDEIDDDGTASLPDDLDRHDDGDGNDVWNGELLRQNSPRNNTDLLDGSGVDGHRMAMEVRPADRDRKVSDRWRRGSRTFGWGDTRDASRSARLNSFQSMSLQSFWRKATSRESSPVPVRKGRA